LLTALFDRFYTVISIINNGVEAYLLEISVPTGVPTDMHDVHYMHHTTIVKPVVIHTIAIRARLLIKVSGVRISGGSPSKCR